MVFLPMTSVTAHDKEHLKTLIRKHINLYGPRCDLNHIDVSGVTNLSCLFQQSNFNGDISKWDVSHVTDMSHLFELSSFEGDISSWNTSSIINMAWMFNGSQFTGDISQWDVSKVADMYNMFSYSPFKGDISAWSLSSLKSLNSLRAFHEFHDSPLGYIGVLRNEYDFPENHPRAAQFQELRSLCDGLNMDVVGAAQYIYWEIHQPSVRLDEYGVVGDHFSFEVDTNA